MPNSEHVEGCTPPCGSVSIQPHQVKAYREFRCRVTSELVDQASGMGIRGHWVRLCQSKAYNMHQALLRSNDGITGVLTAQRIP